MRYTSLLQYIAKWLVIASFLGAGFAMAQAEPTMSEVYATAKAGKLDQAQVMIQQVLISHPKSAKAHFVQSELYARQGNQAKAREALATAEKLAPGLPFAKPAAVAALRSQLAAKSSAPVTQHVAPPSYAAPSVAPSAPASSSFSWGLPLLLAGGVIVAGYFMFRRKAPDPFAQPPAYANQGGMAGPQSFGMAGGAGPGAVMQPGYGQAPYGQPAYGQNPYGQPAGSGLGGRIMGGVATGLAVGAGVMAAEAIGRNLMGNHNQPTPPADSLSNSNTTNDYQPLAGNTDLGGQDFGINDASSWDDSSSGGDAGGGGDWDN